jgi:glycosyltransferase involved in cell wall biosynthesis
MRIAFFSDNFYPEISGISDSIIMLGQELAKRGHDIRYYAPRFSQKNFAIANLAYQEFGGNNISVRRVASLPYLGSPTSQARIAQPFPTILFDIKRFRPDIIHIHSPFGVGLQGLAASRYLHIPAIGTNHTPIGEFMKENAVSRLMTGMTEHFYAWFYNRLAFVSTPSHDMGNGMKTWGFRKPYTVISNPIDTTLFSPPQLEEKNVFRKKYNLQGLTFLYVGRLAPEKHLDIIIRSFSEFKKQEPSAKLIITGHGSAEKDLKQLAARLHLEDSVQFVGFVERLTLVEYYKAADVFVVMSTAETQCLGMMQAMASGLPTIAARARALPEYLPHTAGILVEPGDTEALTKAMTTLRMAEMRHTMGAIARQQALKYSIHDIADTWEKVYQGYTQTES